jgi:hypothetical protein
LPEEGSEAATYPLRVSRYANHLYTDHQLVVLLAERQHLRKSCRDFCEMIEVCTSLLEELELKKVPHRTKPHKSSKRAETRRLETLLLLFIEGFNKAFPRKRRNTPSSLWSMKRLYAWAL